jgi:outer membrane beta-barrel protein
MKLIARALAFVLLAASVVPVGADAAEPEKVVVRNRKFTSEGKFEVSANVGLNLAAYLTDHTNLVLDVAYNITENWAVQLAGGYAISRHTSVAQTASDTIVKSSPATSAKIVDDFEDLWQMTWNATGAVRWTPIYGKLNIAAELPVHFQLYLLLGGGAGGMFRDSLVYCIGARPTSGTVSCSANPEGTELKALHASEVKPIVLGGLGMKFFVNEWAGLRLEVRDMAFPDSYRVKINRASAEADTGARDAGDAAATQGEKASSPGFTNLVFFQIGAVFAF